MTKTERRRLEDKIDNEGFDYCFRHYSSFPEIKDKKFHELRKAYIAASEALEKHLLGIK